MAELDPDVPQSDDDFARSCLHEISPGSKSQEGSYWWSMAAELANRLHRAARTIEEMQRDEFERHH